MFIRYNYINFGNKNVFFILFYCINLSFIVLFRIFVEFFRFDGFFVVLLFLLLLELGSGFFVFFKFFEYVILVGLGRGGFFMNKVIIIVYVFFIKF